MTMSVRERANKKKFLEEFEAEEQRKREIAEAPLRAMAKRVQDTHSELARAERAQARQQAFKEPSEELNGKCLQYRPDGMKAPQITQAIGESFEVFRAALKKRGITLEKSAMDKFRKLSEVNITCDTRDPRTFMTMFNFLDGLGLLDGDCVKPAAPEPVAETSAPEPESIDDINISTREGARQARKIVDKQFWQQASPLFHEWIASLYEHWKFVPSEPQKRDAFNLILDLNLSPLDRRSYDVLRKAAASKGIFPELLTNEEMFEREIENFRKNNPHATAREERQWYLFAQRGG